MVTTLKAAGDAPTSPAERFLEYVNRTGSPYHSVEAVRPMLLANGFTELKEGDLWKIERGGRYYVIRNHSTICAFVVGGAFDAAKGGMAIVGGHTDSPCLRIRPNSCVSGSGYLQVGVETYGGGLWHTWFDRGLGVAGKVVVSTKDAEGKVVGLAEKLVRIAKPICIVPNLAIHLTTDRNGFNYNAEANLQPVLCSKLKEQLNAPADPAAAPSAVDRHHSVLLQTIAEEVGCEPSAIVDMDLCLMDATPSRLCGLYSEFVESPRLDNLVSTFGCFTALVEVLAAQPASSDIWVAAAFDHEEVGSTSLSGANSNAVESWIERVLGGLDAAAYRLPIMARSFLVSSDMAHGVHPNYAEKHQAQHRPLFHKGVVLKESSNQRYCTMATSSAIIRTIAAKAEPAVPIQDFVVRNDSPCGSTIGPMLSSRLGVRSIDIGLPQWAMHSIRETCGADDIGHLVNLCKAIFVHFREVDKSLTTVQ